MASGLFYTASAIKVERSHTDVEQLLALLRFEPREKLAELSGDLLGSLRNDFLKLQRKFIFTQY
jgi:hypothetical protein